MPKTTEQIVNDEGDWWMDTKWYQQSEVDELKKKLKERIDALSFSIKGTRYTDLAYVDGIHLAITNVFDEVTKK